MHKNLFFLSILIISSLLMFSCGFNNPFEETNLIIENKKLIEDPEMVNVAGGTVALQGRSVTLSVLKFQNMK